MKWSAQQHKNNEAKIHLAFDTPILFYSHLYVRKYKIKQKKNYNEMREYKGSVKLQKDLFSVQTRFSSMSGSWDIHTVFDMTMKVNGGWDAKKKSFEKQKW